MIKYSAKHMVLFVVSCFFLQACPIPAIYSTILAESENSALLKSHNCNYEFDGGIPWRERQRKNIAIYVKVTNMNEYSSVADYNFFSLESSLITYKLKSLHPQGKPDFFLNFLKDTILGKDFITRVLIYESVNDISRKSYWRNIENDTLKLIKSNSKEQIYFIGKDNRKVR